MSLFGIEEKRRIKHLEAKIERYREDNQALRDENKRLEEFELKVKIMEMYVNDDEAINELLECSKSKVNQQLADQQRMAVFGSMNSLGMAGGTGGGVYFNQLAAARNA